MIKIENVVLASPEQMQFIIQGMRNPLNSWAISDSGGCERHGSVECGTICDLCKPIPENPPYVIKDKDLVLMKKLAKAGTEHRKFMRMMPVYVRITAPLYWVAEHDTYKVSTVRNSCSFMHKGLSKRFEMNDFSYSVENQVYIEDAIAHLNILRKEYLETKDERTFQAIRQLLPSGYNVSYNWSANYEVLSNIYHCRKDHRLQEWRDFCKWIEALPYSELITGRCE